MPAFQGWVEPLNLPATQIDKDSGSPNGILTHTSHTSEVLEERTSITGKKVKAGTTYRLQNLSRYGKKTCQFLN